MARAKTKKQNEAQDARCGELRVVACYAKLAASGKDSVIASSAYAKGVEGTWIALAEYNADGKCIGFATGCVGQNGIPADTWLRAKGGKLVAA